MITLNTNMFNCYYPPVALGDNFVLNLKSNRFDFLEKVELRTTPLFNTPHDSEGIKPVYVAGFDGRVGSYYFGGYYYGDYYDIDIYASFKKEFVSSNGRYVVYFDTEFIGIYDLVNKSFRKIRTEAYRYSFSPTFGFVRHISGNIFMIFAAGSAYYYVCFLNAEKGILFEKYKYYCGNSCFYFSDYFFTIKNDVVYVFLPFMSACSYNRHLLYIFKIIFNLKTNEYRIENELLETYYGGGVNYYWKSLAKYLSNFVLIQEQPENNKLLLWFRDTYNNNRLSYMEYDFDSDSYSNKGTYYPDNYVKKFIFPDVDYENYSVSYRYERYKRYYERYYVPRIKIIPMGNNVYMFAVIKYNRKRRANNYSTFGASDSSIAFVKFDPVVKRVSLINGIFPNKSSLFGNKYLVSLTSLNENNFLIALSPRESYSPFNLAQLSVNPETFDINVSFLKEYDKIDPYAISSVYIPESNKTYVLLEREGGNIVDIYATGMAENVEVRLEKVKSSSFPYETNMVIEAFDLFKNSSYAEIMVKLVSTNIEFTDKTTVKIVKVYPHQPAILPVRITRSGKIKISAKIINSVK